MSMEIKAARVIIPLFCTFAGTSSILSAYPTREPALPDHEAS